MNRSLSDCKADSVHHSLCCFVLGETEDRAGAAGIQWLPHMLPAFVLGPGPTGKLVKLDFDPPILLPSCSPFPPSPLSKRDGKLTQRKVSRTSNQLAAKPVVLPKSTPRGMGRGRLLLCLCPGLILPSTAWTLLIGHQCCRNFSGKVMMGV